MLFRDITYCGRNCAQYVSVSPPSLPQHVISVLTGSLRYELPQLCQRYHWHWHCTGLGRHGVTRTNRFRPGPG